MMINRFDDGPEEDVEIITIADWYDAPLSGIAEHDGKKLWYSANYPKCCTYDLYIIPENEVDYLLTNDELTYEYNEDNYYGWFQLHE